MTLGQGRRKEFESGTAKGVWGLYSQWGSKARKGQTPLVGVRGQSPLKLVLFFKNELEFVQQVDGTIITKLIIKSYVFSFFKLKSDMANAVSAVVVPTALP